MLLLAICIADVCFIRVEVIAIMNVARELGLTDPEYVWIFTAASISIPEETSRVHGSYPLGSFSEYLFRFDILHMKNVHIVYFTRKFHEQYEKLVRFRSVLD